MRAHVCSICEGCIYVVNADLWTYVHTCGGQVASSATFHHMPLQQGLSLNWRWLGTRKPRWTLYLYPFQLWWRSWYTAAPGIFLGCWRPESRSSHCVASILTHWAISTSSPHLVHCLTLHYLSLWHSQGDIVYSHTLQGWPCFASGKKKYNTKSHCDSIFAFCPPQGKTVESFGLPF